MRIAAISHTMFYLWSTISPPFRGPANTNLQGTNTAHLTVSGLHLDGSKDPTVYQFNLTAWNEMSQPTTDTAFVFLYSSKFRKRGRGGKGEEEGRGGRGRRKGEEEGGGEGMGGAGYYLLPNVMM